MATKSTQASENFGAVYGSDKLEETKKVTLHEEN
jgi:hypothetical protein